MITECRLPEPLNAFTATLPPVPGALRTASVGAYTYCLSSCPLGYIWKELPAGYWPRYVRLAYCQSKNCSFPQGLTCQVRGFFKVSKHCADLTRKSFTNLNKATSNAISKSGNLLAHAYKAHDRVTTRTHTQTDRHI